jgi:hypothetical protein
MDLTRQSSDHLVVAQQRHLRERRLVEVRVVPALRLTILPVELRELRSERDILRRRVAGHTPCGI